MIYWMKGNEMWKTVVDENVHLYFAVDDFEWDFAMFNDLFFGPVADVGAWDVDEDLITVSRVKF